MEIVLPIFCVVAAGYGATFTGVFDTQAGRGLQVFVFWFAIPVMLFRSVATAQAPDGSAWPFLAAYYGATAAVLLVGILVARGSLARRTIIGFGGCYSNTVLLGIPLILTSLGPGAALPLFLVLAFHSLIFFSAVTLLLEYAADGRANLRAMPRQLLKGLTGNPIIMAMMTGLLVAALGLPLPALVDRFATLVGQAAVPCALFSMGASLRNYRIAGAIRPAMLVVALKLGLHPLLVGVLVYGVLDIDPVWAGTAMIASSLPTGVNVYLFATRYKVGEAESATAVLISSILSLPVVTVVMWLVVHHQ